MIDTFGETITLIMLSGTRIGVAAWVMPVFSQSVMPATVRNSLCVTLGLLVLTQPGLVSLGSLTPTLLGAMIAREAVIGTLIGFLFAMCILAFQIAGQLIDAKAGTTMAQLADPFAGANFTTTAMFLNQWAMMIFASLGGLMWFVGTMMESFVLLPIEPTLPTLGVFAERLMTLEFARLMALALAIAAPVLIILFMVELSLGLMNRFAQALNSYQLSMGLKSWSVAAALALALGTYASAFVQQLATARAQANAAVAAPHLLGTRQGSRR